MATRKKQNKKKPSLLAWLRANLWQTIAGLTATIILGVLIYSGVSAWNEARLTEIDRQRFETVKQDVKTISDRLQKASDAGVKWEFNANCIRAHVVYGPGDAGCSVITIANIPVESAETASALAIKYNDHLNKSADIISMQNTMSNFDTTFLSTLESKESTGQTYEHNSTNMLCSSFFELRGSDKDKIIHISFMCHGDSRDTYFPRSDI